MIMISGFILKTKKKTYRILEETLEFEPSYPEVIKRPMISFLSDKGEKVV